MALFRKDRGKGIPNSGFEATNFKAAVFCWQGGQGRRHCVLADGGRGFRVFLLKCLKGMNFYAKRVLDIMPRAMVKCTRYTARTKMVDIAYKAVYREFPPQAATLPAASRNARFSLREHAEKISKLVQRDMPRDHRREPKCSQTKT